VDAFQYFFPARAVISAHGRKIGTAEKGFGFGCEKNIQRPSAAAAHGLYCIHVNMVEVWAFFAVYLDVDEIFVHDGRRAFIFKAFAFHHMAPMAGSITDAYEDRLVFIPCFLQSFLTPGKPVYRVMGMLQKIRTRFVDECIGGFHRNTKLGTVG
jgi:hypothetical protein